MSKYQNTSFHSCPTLLPDLRQRGDWRSHVWSTIVIDSVEDGQKALRVSPPDTRNDWVKMQCQGQSVTRREYPECFHQNMAESPRDLWPPSNFQKLRSDSGRRTLSLALISRSHATVEIDAGASLLLLQMQIYKDASVYRSGDRSNGWFYFWGVVSKSRGIEIFVFGDNMLNIFILTQRVPLPGGKIRYHMEQR